MSYYYFTPEQSRKIERWFGTNPDEDEARREEEEADLLEEMKFHASPEIINGARVWVRRFDDEGNAATARVALTDAQMRDYVINYLKEVK